MPTTTLQKRKSQPEVLSNVFGGEEIAKKYHPTCPTETTFLWTRQPKLEGQGSTMKGRPPVKFRSSCRDL